MLVRITGVPFFVLHRRYAVSGAQPADLLLAALERTWADTISWDILCGIGSCVPRVHVRGSGREVVSRFEA